MTEFSTGLRQQAEFTDEDFTKISKIAKSNYGINLEISKKAMIKSRISKRLAALKITSFSQYCDLIDRGDSSENEHFISALTTNVTHFYREKHHFDLFDKHILPELASKLISGGKIQIWSAACSSGQEPFSISGSVLNHIPNASSHDIKIYATDIDPKILEAAKAGRFSVDNCKFPSDDYRNRIFGSICSKLDTIPVKSKVKDLVYFDLVNLNGEWRFREKFDVIFCRNAAIYFDRETQEKLWYRLCDRLVPGGYLFIGHSERIHGRASSQLVNIGITSYQRRDTRSGTTTCH